MLIPTTTAFKAHYLMPGSFFNEETSRELTAWDVDEAVAKAPKEGPYGAGAFAFTLAEYLVPATPLETTAGKEFKVYPIEVRRSGKYYLGGRIWTLAEVEEGYPNEGILIQNMKGNGWKRLVRTPFGNWQPFEKGDKLVEQRVGA